MPRFVYRAVTEDGKIVRNTVDELSRKTLIKKLMKNGIMPITIVQRRNTIVASSNTKKKKNVNVASEMMQETNLYVNLDGELKKKSAFERINHKLLTQTSKITMRDVTIFTQDFYLLKKANFNNIHALSTIIDKTENPRFKEILKDILAGVEAGENMYTTMEYYDDVFPYLYINMIRVGELSGSLTKSLEEAVNYLEETDALNKRLRGILVPNILMLIGIIVLLFVGMLVIIPTIQGVFNAMGSKDTLPAITIWFAGVVDKLMKFWYIPLIIIAGIVAGIIAYISTPKGRYNFDYFKYTMPLFGKLIFSLDFLRLSRAMLLNLKNGIRIQDALEVSKNICKNYVMRAILESSINNMIIGQSWIEPFEKMPKFPPMIKEMLRIGMETDMPEMIDNILKFINEDIDITIRRITATLQQVSMAIMGVVIIGFVIIILKPIMEVYMGSFLFEANGM